MSTDQDLRELVLRAREFADGGNFEARWPLTADFIKQMADAVERLSTKGTCSECRWLQGTHGRTCTNQLTPVIELGSVNLDTWGCRLYAPSMFEPEPTATEKEGQADAL